MATIRKTASIENGIMRVLKILNDEEILAAIGKTSSYLRKCSNPNDPDRHIDHNDSVRLDLACIKKGKAPPLLRAHEYIVANVADNLESHKLNDIDEMLVKSTILHGKLTEVVKLAEDPKSDEGKEISKLEKKKIIEAIKNLEDKIMKIKITVDQK
tara:strand:- start:227 stop:694 length:468 start_codon:yes stop_codon:yes gene_type:complete